MAEAVVDVLEPVQIDHQQRHKLIIALRSFHRVLQTRQQQQAVRQPGQRIVVGAERNSAQPIPPGRIKLISW